MQILWRLKKGFVKDIIAEIPGEKPPYNTVSSVVRLLVKKGFVNFKQYGNTYEYYPVISKAKYRKKVFTGILNDYFDNSYKKVVSFLTSENELDKEDADELLRIIKESRQKKNDK